MKSKVIFTNIFFLFAFCIILSLTLVIIIGKPIEKLETRLYQKIAGKKPQYFLFDSLGVPSIVFESNLGKQYNAVSVSEYAIKIAGNKEREANEHFFNCIKWLMENNYFMNDSSIIFLDKYNWPSYNMTSPWRSAMNQGRVMQAFLAAFQKTGDTIYLNLAKKTMNTLFTKVSDGGVTYIDSTGYWYEEYADDNVPQSRVLNGMIVVLQALSDYYEVTKDPNANFLFKKGVESVKKTIYLFDNKGHSNYDILGKPASSWYHKFHIELLDFLYQKTGDLVFKEYRERWKQYKEPGYLTSFSRKPTNIGLFAVFTIFAAVSTILFSLYYFFWMRGKGVTKVEKAEVLKS